MLRLISIVLFAVAALVYVFSSKWRRRAGGWVFIASYAFGALTLLLLIGAVVFYLLTPTYLDHFEPIVAEVSWLGIHGQAVYPDYQTGDVYETVYGPVLFLINGLGLLMIPSILGSKVPGCLALVASLFFFYTLVRFKNRNDTKLSIITFLIFSGLLFSFHDRGFPFWNRSEPFLILLSILAMHAAQRLSYWKAVITIGALAGLSSGFKIHGALYVLPALLSVAGSRESFRQRLSSLLVAGCIGALVVVVTFFPLFVNGWVEVKGYENDMLMTSHHGLVLKYFLENCLFATLLLAPALLVLLVGRPVLGNPERWFVAGLLVSAILAAVVGSKEGAGAYHLLPLVPAAVYCGLFVICAPKRHPDANLDWRQIAAIFMLSFGLVFARSNILFARSLLYQTNSLASENQKIIELENIRSRFPEVEMGISDKEHYKDTNYRIILTLLGLRPHIDFASLMDFQFAGYSEARLLKFMRTCEINAWVLPLGAPFTMTNYYSGAPLVSDEFKAMFYDRYQLVETDKYFQLWKCRKQPLPS